MTCTRRYDYNNVLVIDSEQITTDVGTAFSDLLMSIEIPWELVSKSRSKDEVVLAVSSVLHDVENLFPSGFLGNRSEAS